MPGLVTTADLAGDGFEVTMAGRDADKTYTFEAYISVPGGGEIALAVVDGASW